MTTAIHTKEFKDAIKQEAIEVCLSIMRSNPDKAMVVDPDEPSVHRIDWSLLSDDDKMAIKGFKAKRGVSGSNANKVPIWNVSCEWHDKFVAIEKLSKLLGLYEADKQDITLNNNAEQVLAVLKELKLEGD